MKKNIVLACLLFSIFLPGVVHAQEAVITGCEENPVICESDTPTFDIRLFTSVKIQGGSYVDANSATIAPTAYGGETVTWRITVQAVTSTPLLDYVVKTVLPVETQFVSANSQSYNHSSGIWSLPSLNEGEAQSLEITTKVLKEGDMAIGSAEVGLITIDDSQSSVFVEITDENVVNNKDSTYLKTILKPEKSPQVLGDSTVAPFVPTPTPTPTRAVLGAATLASTGGNSTLGSITALTIILLSTVLYVFTTKKS